LFCNKAQLYAQCLSSLNPVGGTNNLLVLEKNTLRFVPFYKYGTSNQYFEKNRHSDFDLIQRAYYNYISAIIGYGITSKLTLETEIGYFINKTQIYNTHPVYTLTGKGFSNIIASAKYNVFADYLKRMHYTVAIGVKAPFSQNFQVVNNVELPVELQPTIGAFGVVFQSAFVKENSLKGLRYFITNRVETNFPNKNGYLLGTSIISSLYISKHLMASWVKGDWTTILQIRNEIRTHDKISVHEKESSGSVLFFITPQINYVYKESWNLSAMFDIPFYQYFNGTQLGAGMGLTFSMSRTYNLKNMTNKIKRIF